METKTMDDRMRELVTRNIKYAKNTAKRYVRQGVMYEDLRQEAELAMCEAALRYEDDGRSKFLTFVTLFMNGRLAKFVMKYGAASYLSGEERVFVKLVSLESLGGEDEDGNVMSGEEIISSDYDGEEARREEEAEMLSSALGCLTEEEREVVDAVYGEEADGGCARLGLSRWQIYRKHQKIMKKMVEHIKTEKQ